MELVNQKIASFSVSKYLNEHLNLRTLLISFFVYLLSFSASIFAQDSRFTITEKIKTDISSGTYFFEDAEGTLSIEDARAETDWQSSNEDVLVLPFSQSYFWIKSHLNFDINELSDWLIYLNVVNYETLELYLFVDGVMLDPYSRSSEIGERPIHHRNFVVPFTLEQPSDVDVYIRVRDKTHITLPISIVPMETFFKETQTSQFLLGTYFGLVVVILLYNLFIYTSTRDVSYLYYVSYVGTIGLYFVGINGIGFQYFWPDSPYFEQNVYNVSVGLSLFFACLFIIEFLKLRELSLKLVLYFYMLAIMGLCSCLFAFSESYEIANRINSVNVLVSSLSFIIVGAYCWRMGYSYASYYTLAWSIFCLLAMMTALVVLGILEYSMKYFYALQVASAVEMVLISFALAARINILRYESHRAQADSKAKSDFLAKMSHEIRTPMTGVLGMSDLLAERLTDVTNIHYNKIIHQSGQALLTIINDILDYSKLEAGHLEIEKEPFNLEELVVETIEVFKVRAMEKSLELIADVDADLPALVEGDPHRIKQVMTNLLSNAVKFTHEGQIVLKVTIENRERNLVKISVIDSGEGVDEDYKQQLFEAFSQEFSESGTSAIERKSGGVGLGLTIGKQLTEMMGGSMGFSSRKGVGSTFWMRLALPTHAGGTRPKKVVIDDLNGLRVLIVDDNFTFCELLKIQVEKWGMEAYIAHNGEQAMNMLQQSEKAMMNFDLVSIDLYMPVMDGLELGREMNRNEAFKNIPRVLLTSVANLPSREKLAESGISLAVEKPCSASWLHESFAKALGLRGEAKSKTPILEDSADSSPGKKLKVLVVEDDEVNQLVIRGMLINLGHSIELLENGQQAVDCIYADDRRFDVILMDCEMPVMDGYEASRKIRQWEKERQREPVKIVALTAHLLEDQRLICLNAGMDVCLDKPIEARKLDVLLRALTEPAN